MPGPYINQAPVDDDTEMRSDSDRPRGTDPQTMAILSRILAMLEAQTAPPPDMGMPPPGMGPPGLPGMGGPPPMPGMGGPPPMPGPGMPPPMGAPGMGPPPGMPPPPGLGGGMAPPGLGGGMPPLPPPGPEMPFTQYAQQRLGRM